MTATPSHGRVPRRDRAACWPGALRGAALAVMLVGVLGSVWVARGWQSTVTRQRDERLDRTAAALTVTIGAALGGYENALWAARSLWLASDHVSRKDFGRFARSLDRETRYPGLQNISWRQIVRDDQAAGFVAAARAEGVEDFTTRPPGRRPVYYVTRYSYPPGSRLGLDARANPGVYASLDVARDSGQTCGRRSTAPRGPGRRPESSSTTRRSARPAWSARSGRQLCVVLLDLDHFKAYNDRHGHQAGDRMLKAAAAAWQARLRRSDLLARYGGEEFAVRLPACGPEEALEIAVRVRTAQPEGTCSLGVAAWDGREDAGQLVDRADRALYAAKEGGRDRCVAGRGAAQPATR